MLRHRGLFFGFPYAILQLGGDCMRKVYTNKPLRIIIISLFVIRSFLILRSLQIHGLTDATFVWSAYSLLYIFWIPLLISPLYPLFDIIVLLLIPLFLVILGINKAGANMASWVLIVYLILDVIFCLIIILTAHLLLLLVGLAYNILLITLLLFLRRSLELDFLVNLPS